ncbi:MAG: site-2 protease family protein [Chloroflexi bacterium]|nr:site-2 protease family protein [Chloroflexota bacterium]
MLRGGIPIGKIFGIAIRLNYSWFIVFGLVTWALSVGYFPSIDPTLGVPTRVVAGLLTSVLFFGSVLAHELMHSVFAQRFGIPVQSITLFIFGGVSQITKEPQKPKDELRIALAGPLTSLVVGGVFWAVWFLAQDASSLVVAIAYWLGWINVSLAVFNLIPGFPLDGGRVLRSILWWRKGNLLQATKTASNIGRGVGYLFIFAGLVQIFIPGLTFQGLWLAFIGWFLDSAASASRREVMMQAAFEGVRVHDVMARHPVTVGPDVTIQEVVDDYLLLRNIRAVPVVEGGRFLGLMTVSDIRRVPRDRWSETPVRAAMTPAPALVTAYPDDSILSVLQQMTERDLNQVPVVADGRLQGLLTRSNLMRFLHLRDELGIRKAAA